MFFFFFFEIGAIGDECLIFAEFRWLFVKFNHHLSTEIPSDSFFYYNALSFYFYFSWSIFIIIMPSVSDASTIQCLGVSLTWQKLKEQAFATLFAFLNHKLSVTFFLCIFVLFTIFFESFLYLAISYSFRVFLEIYYLVFGSNHSDELIIMIFYY